jgi:isopenicillin N synthase-like dioxygenase
MGSSQDTEYPNKWPTEEELPGFRAFAEDYFNRFQALSLEIMGALEVGMSLPRGIIVDQCGGSASEIRWNHYPQVAVDEILKGTTNRIWPHTDFGVLTLLFQDNVGGLEFQDSKNPDVFVPVTRKSNEMIINCGDTLQRWTNNYLKAGLHQVTLPIEASARPDDILKDRYSIAFFLKADRNARVAPIQKFIPEGTTSQYDDVSALEYQVRKNVPLY